MRLISTIVLGAALSACTPAPPATPEPDAAPAVTAPAADPSPAVAPAVENVEPSPPLPEAVPGGYASVGLEDATVKAAQAMAIDAIYAREPTRALVEKVEARIQVVAGYNYAFAITMTGGARYNVVVFQSPGGKLEVTRVNKIG